MYWTARKILWAAFLVYLEFVAISILSFWLLGIPNIMGLLMMPVFIGVFYVLPAIYYRRVSRAFKIAMKAFISECFKLPYQKETVMRIWERWILGSWLIMNGVFGVIMIVVITLVFITDMFTA